MRFHVTDNSGALEANLIRVLNNKKGKMGDFVVVSLVKVLPNKKVKKGEIYKGLIVRTKNSLVRSDGSCLKFQENSLILLTDEFLPIASRIFGPLPLELCKHKQISLLTTLYI